MAKEVHPQNKHVDRILTFELYKQYQSDIKKVAAIYNKKINSKKFKKTLAKIPFLKGKHHNLKLGKAYIKDEKLYLGQTGVKLAFNAYLNDSLIYQGKRIKLDCNSHELCLRDFSSHFKRKVSFNFFISNAHANFENLTKSDYKVLAALISFDESFEDIDSTFNPLSNDEKRLSQKILNLQKLKRKISEENSNCNDWLESYEDYGKAHSFTIPSSYSSMYSIAKRILELEEDKAHASSISKKLGKKMHSYTGITVSSDIFGISSRGLNSQWKTSLECKSIPRVLTFLSDKGANKKGRFCTDSTCRDIKLDDVSNSAKEFCKSMESLKMCLAKFYKAAQSDFNDNSRLGADENEKEYFEELFEKDPTLKINSGKVEAE